MPVTAIRYFNAIRTGFSFLYSNFTGSTIIPALPPALGIELTNHCNLRCPECLTGSGLMKREKGYMKPELFGKIISELRPFLLNVNLYFQGESMMHPQFFEFLRLSKGLNTTLSTNGHFISSLNADEIVNSGLSRLIISLDGMDSSTYNAYRINGNFDQVVSGIEAISESKRRNSSGMMLVIQLLVNRLNEHQISRTKSFAERINAKPELKSMQIINEESFKVWIPQENSLSRYETKGTNFVLKNRFPNRCARLWFNPVITWDGKVVPCCFDKDADYIMGDLNEEAFRDIWNNKKFRNFRKKVMVNRREIEICRNCTSGLRS